MPKEPVGRIRRGRVYDEAAKDLLTLYPSWLRAMHIWFHGAHNVTRGSSFGGDHAPLFGKIYEAIGCQVDGALEKIIGVTNDESLADPNLITQQALEIMGRYPSPVTLAPKVIAATGLDMVQSYLEWLENTFKALESRDLLTLGLNDHMASNANCNETWVYLLQQRIKQD